MKIRIISGVYGGRRIEAPSTTITHPMGDRVRSALFNTISSSVAGASVLDAFAGSGAVGLEALSRGADHVTFIEKDRTALRAVKSNITALDAGVKVNVLSTTIDAWLNTDPTDRYDLIIADPPYDAPQFSTIERLQGLLKPNGLMVLSHAGIGEVPTKFGIVVVDNRSYGNAHLTYFRRDAT